MRDGVVLRADVVRPADGRPAPVVLVRSPYPLEGVRFELNTTAVVRRGLALVVQSARGTGASDGDFEPWVDEESDGVDTIAWCAGRPWSTGRVATLGRSYLAQAQLFAAGGRPPALRAMGLGVVPGEPYDLVRTGGVLNLGATLNWAMGMTAGAIARRAATGEDMAADRRRWAELMSDPSALYRTAPLTDIPLLDEHFRSWRSWVEHPQPDGYWRARALPEREPVPAIVVGGWHDVFLEGTLREFTRSAQHPASRLVVGPWSHGLPGSSLGDVDHGVGASGPAIGLETQVLDFLATHLTPGPRDRPAREDAVAPVRLFVMGADRWRDEQTWPPERAVDTDLHLHPGGRLAADPPTTPSAPSTFRFDPRDPVPTVGGRNLLPGGDAANLCGSVDQRVLDGRRDILRFVSAPLTAGVEVVGAVRVTLHAATSAVDTDWTAKLVDVHPDGTALNVVDGIVRAGHRDPAQGERLLEPNRAHELTIELGATAQLFAAGHRIRLDVSSSNFPRFDRNPGTGATTGSAREADFVTADQSVLHDPDHPSRVTLPVIGA